MRNQAQRWIFKKEKRDSPASPVVKIPCSQCRGYGFNPWLGNYSTCHMEQAKKIKEIQKKKRNKNKTKPCPGTHKHRVVRPGVQHWDLLLQSLRLATAGNGRAEIEPGDTVSITEKLRVHIDASEQEPRFHHISYTSLWFWRLPFGIGEKLILSCTCHLYNPFCPSEPAIVPTADWTTNAEGKHFLGRKNSLWEVPEVTFSRNWEKGGMERKRESSSWQRKRSKGCAQLGWIMSSLAVQ